MKINLVNMCASNFNEMSKVFVSMLVILTYTWNNALYKHGDCSLKQCTSLKACLLRLVASQVDIN